MTSQTDRYLNAVVPRKGWLSGASKLAQDPLGRMDSAVRLLVRPLCFCAAAEASGWVLERIWHPAFYLPWIAALAYSARELAFAPYQEAAKADADLVTEAMTIVRHDLGLAPEDRLLLPDPESASAVEHMLAHGGAAARECVMRLAALRTQAGRAEPGQIRAVAAAIVSKAVQSPPSDDSGDEAAARATLSRIAGTDVETAGIRLVYDQTGARLRAIAEHALADDPNLTDASGAPLAPLVRTHLPDLLDAHAAALRVADADGAAEAERELADGLERIRLSVEEALTASRRQASERLANQVGFLRMRRGDA